MMDSSDYDFHSSQYCDLVSAQSELALSHVMSAYVLVPTPPPPQTSDIHYFTLSSFLSSFSSKSFRYGSSWLPPDRHLYPHLTTHQLYMQSHNDAEAELGKNEQMISIDIPNMDENHSNHLYHDIQTRLEKPKITSIDPALQNTASTSSTMTEICKISRSKNTGPRRSKRESPRSSTSSASSLSSSDPTTDSTSHNVSPSHDHNSSSPSLGTSHTATNNISVPISLNLLSSIERYQSQHYSKLSKPESDEIVSNELKSFLHQKAWKPALHLCESYDDTSVNMWNMAISACARSGNYKKAIECLERMKSVHKIKPDVISYTTCIRACQKNARWQEAVNLLNQMHANKVKPNVITYNTVISACEKGRQWRKALALLGEMEKYRIQPDVITYSSCISACEKGLQVEKALDLLLQMRLKNIIPNVITYSACISACAKRSKWKTALELLQTMQSEYAIEPDVVCYSACITACARTGHWQDASRLFSQLKTKGIKPNLYTYSSYLKALDVGKQYSKALQVIEEMKQNNVKPDIVCYTSCISVCAKQGMVEEAIAIFREMKSRGIKPSLITYNACITACVRRSMWRRAIYFKHMSVRAGLVPDVVTYSACISACGTAGKPQRALQLLQEMRSRDITPNVVAYTACIRAFSLKGMSTDALQLLHDMKEQLKLPLSSFSTGTNRSTSPSADDEKRITYKQLKPNEITYYECMTACLRDKKYSKVIELFNEMIAANLEPNGRVYSVCALACEQGNLWDEAKLIKLKAEESKLSLPPNVKKVFQIVESK